MEKIEGFYETSLKSVKFPKSVKRIVGFDKTPLETIEFPEGVEEIAGFSGTSLKSVKFPKSVKYISGFSDSSLETIEFPEFVEGMLIEEISGFEKCKNLKSVKIPKYVKVIDGFNDCENLENIELSEGIEAIKGFFNTACKNLIVPSSVKLICISEYSYDRQGGSGNNFYFLGKNTNVCCYWGGTEQSGESWSFAYPMLCYDGSKRDEWYGSFFGMISYMEENMKEWDINISVSGKGFLADKTNIYCYEDSIVANLKNDFPDYFNVQYITSDTKIPTIPEQKPNNPTTTTTKYTTLPLTTINNQLYVKGINPESNTVEQIIKSGKFAEGTTVKVYKYGQEIADSEKVGTGSVIKVLENGEVKEEYIVVVYGDTDGDGEITSIDALAIVKNKTGKIPFTTEAQKEAARLLTKTGTSGAVDALAIVKSRTGKAVINQENGTVSKK